MVMEHNNYREFLRAELAKRKCKNPSYSMRAFAAQVGLTQSALSQVMSGKKNLSSESATRIANLIGLSESEADYFRTLIQMAKTQNPDLMKSLTAKAQGLNPQREVRELSVEYFSMISDWYHLAIKNLLDVDGFEFTTGNIAKSLRISKLEAEAAIDRLVRMHAIETDPTKNDPTNTRYRRVDTATVVKSDVKNEALRRFHRQMLEKAIESLETQTPQEKWVGSETFPFSEELLPEANQIIENFMTAITDLSDRSKRRDHVYHLGVQLFKLTNGRN
jgi:uncharacterized protein (TIGR02147 family)